MRLVRLVAAGLLLGAVTGFLAALLRPRTVHQYHPVPVDRVRGADLVPSERPAHPAEVVLDERRAVREAAR